LYLYQKRGHCACARLKLKKQETNTDEDGPSVFDGGRYADTVSQTLADVAMEYYENDLFTSVDNEVPVTARDIAGVPAGTFDVVETMHQHVKTYGIAFGVEGTIDAAVAEAWDVGTAYPWPDPFDDTLFKLDEVVHTAVNGRGDFLSAGNPQELQAAIESAFLEFLQAASSASAAAFNSTSLRNGTLLYRGFYDLRDRAGEITTTEVSNAGVIAATPEWLASEELDAPTKLPNDRVLVTWNPASEAGVPFRFASLAPVQQVILDSDRVDYIRGVRTQEQPLGDLRTRNATRGLLGPIINSSPVFVGSPRGINRDQAPFPTDDLYSDFVNAYDTRAEVVYVGANDGMMHGFAAQTGEELFGYVPNMILDSSKTYSNKLNDYSSPFYYHNYYVDLSPRLNDIYMRPSVGGSKQWMTALVGGLGSGGKGFFALNVTNPTSLYAIKSSASAAILWEFTDEDDTYPEDSSGNPIGSGALTDPDGNPIKDMGYANSLPVVQMTNLNDGGTPVRNEWAAIFGNGSNSTAGYSTLFVLLMDAGIDGWSSGDFVKIPTDYGLALSGEQQAGFPNGRSTPTAVDVDLNGTVDYVYAGDRLGNLFRFDLTSDDSADWHAVHLFKATCNDGVDDIIQPILSKPLVVKNPDEFGFMVIFGIGSYLSSSDASNTEIQSIYVIWDRLDNNPPTTNANTKADRLVEQTITSVVDDSGAVAITRRIVSRNAVGLVADGGSTGTYGWYIDLDMERAADTISGATNPDTSGQAPPNPQFAGERAIRRILFRNGALITTTILPATDEFSCSGVRPGAVLVMNAFSGGDLEQAIIDFNTDGVVDENDLIEVDGEFYSGGLLFSQNDLDGALVDLSTLGGEGDTDFLFISGGNDTEAYRITGINEGRTGRLSWVELQDAN
jgi:type IV pilus assembly protein PilY1